MTVNLTRVVRFSAAHRYYRPEWSTERNVAAFGSCANEHGHGHNYECHVTVKGVPAASTSMVMNLKELDQLLQRRIVAPLDHQHLNYVVPQFASGMEIPTAEALAVHFWNELSSELPDGVTLVRVRVHEDDTLHADYYGETS
ncbi:MAG: 6-carboxytetrahydropterin synthase [Gemmatimonadales bacterium]